jgi:hypothetical protein
MSRHGRVDSSLCRLRVANLANENDVGILTQGAAKSLGKARRVDADLSLGEQGHPLGKEKLNRVFDRDHVAAKALIHPIQCRRKSRTLSRACGTANENQPGLPCHPLPKELSGKTERFQIRHFAPDAPKHSRPSPKLTEQIYAKANAAFGCETRVMVLSPLRSATLPPQGIEKCSIKGRKLECHEASADADLGRLALMKKQIRRIVFAGGRA